MVQLDLFDEAKRIVEAGPEEVARWCKLYLKEHQRRIDECNELVTKCNQLEKKLEIATKTLEYYDTWFDGRLSGHESEASKALEQIQEVK